MTAISSAALRASPWTAPIAGSAAGVGCALSAADFPWLESVSAFKRFVRLASNETDKVTVHSFQHVYFKYLRRLLRGKCVRGAPEQRRVRVLEVGLGCGMRQGPGGGVRMWRALFRALDLELHVMEFAEDCARRWAGEHPGLVRDPEVRLHYGNQGSGEDLRRVAREAGNGTFDLVIDDGSHLNEHMHLTLVTLFPLVAPGGVYVLEDLMSACKRWPVNWGGAEVPRGEKAWVDGTADCMRTGDGNATMMARILAWQTDLGGRGARALPELPGLVHIDVFREAAAFERERPDEGA